MSQRRYAGRREIGDVSELSELCRSCSRSFPTPIAVSLHGSSDLAANAADRQPKRRTRAVTVRPAAPQAREDRDLRCSARPFTASRAAITLAYRSGEEFRDAARAATTAESRYAIDNHWPRLTRGLFAGRADQSGGPGGGSASRGSRQHPWPIRWPGARRGHRGL